MKNLPGLGCLAFLLVTGCNSAPTATKANSPGAPPASAASAASPSLAGVDIRPAVELQLPTSAHGQSYLQLVSAKVLKAESLSVRQPASWTALRQAKPVVPGYRLSYEAVLRWQPITQGPDEQKMSVLTLYTPNGRDTVASIYSAASSYLPDTSGFTSSQIKPQQSVTVHGTLYAYAGTSQQRPALIVYPYNHKGDAFTNELRHLALPFPRQ
ncbi:hypothetical protein GCM10023172_01020 [Hymenobacter ginsengisoli]|uniref:Lipoprotein n=1 Tax=Hymenobacter ginsengisoli TaxID=1051626 RepID=A0ABP8PUF3_9BACT|nr:MULTISPECIES: hypothetical protein [unclassified Hymenobacter]MBO2033501.1 hypothetical protein [Hymenobacter sp. BT559]